VILSGRLIAPLPDTQLHAYDPGGGIPRPVCPARGILGARGRGISRISSDFVSAIIRPRPPTRGQDGRADTPLWGVVLRAGIRWLVVTLPRLAG